MFPVDLRARKHLLIAGGIGITPITAMIDQLCDSAEGPAPFELHYASRSPEHAVFADRLSMRLGARVKFYYSNQRQRIPFAEVLANQPLGTHLYVCGPQTMTDEIRSVASEMGWPEAHLHQELFQSAAVGKPFRLELAKSQLTVMVAADQSMLEAIEAAGVEAPYMCRGGACGQCEVRVVARDGILLHADHYLTESEKASGEKIMPCVSRFEGAALVIDL
jgi:ferredoxin-NADP reductase